MVRSFEYAVLRVIPDARRGECVNVGLVIFKPSGIDVRILQSLSKVSVLNGRLNLDQIRILPKVIEEWTHGVSDSGARHALLKNLGVVSVSDLGYFEISTDQEYEDRIAKLMRNLVVPVAGKRGLQSNVHIKTALKSKFHASRILGTDTVDIARHRVVPDYPIDPDEGLFADFVLKNKVYHVTETADFRAATISNIGRYRAASFAAIKLDKAKSHFGRHTRRFVVYASRDDLAAQPIQLLRDYSDRAFNLASKQEMAEYMEHMVEAAGPNIAGVR